MKNPLLINIIYIVTVLTLVPLVANSGIIIPAHNQQITGFVSDTAPETNDSTVDFSDIRRYGEGTTWRYIHVGDTSLIEHREASWRGYRLYGQDSDTVTLVHTEDYRERSDFEIPLLMGAVESSTKDSIEMPYTAVSRRDMTFCYADSGVMTIRRSLTPYLILEEGDTLRNKLRLETERRFIRKNADTDQPLGIVTDREISWHEDGHLDPLASIVTRIVETDGRDPYVTKESYVFPRSLNGIEKTDAETRSISDLDMNQESSPSRSVMPVGEGDFFIAYLDNTRITIHTDFECTVTICDVSGKVWREKTSPGDVSIPIEGLPTGEYVVSANDGDTVRSMTFTHRP